MIKYLGTLRIAFLLFVAILFSFFEVKSQYARITYPIDRSIFQQKFDENTPISLSFQIDMLRFTQETGLSGGVPIYQVEEVDLKKGETVLSTPRSWASLSPFSNWSLNAIDLKGYLINNLSLPRGWYKVTIGVFFSDPSANFIAPLSSVKFGVGDVYISAGQSNASGYDEIAQDSVVNYAQTYPSKEQYDCVSFIKSPKLVESEPFNYSNLDILGLPFNPVNDVTNISARLSRLNNGNEADKNKIYPNGRGSWFWAQFAHRMAKDKNTPVMILNVATPDTRMEDWASSFNTNRYKQLKRTIQTYSSIYGLKSILWQQGENDVNPLRTNSDQNGYLSTYSSRLNNMIGWSRGDLLMSNDQNELKKLSWHISKISYANAAESWTVTTPSTSPPDPIISTLICKINTRDDITKKMVSAILKNAQQNNPSNNIFRGVFADDIGECDRAEKLRIHFTGEGTNLSLQTMGDRWYGTVDTNYVNSAVVGKQLLPINVQLDANNKYVLKGPRKAGNVQYAKYFWVKNGDGVYDASKVLSTSVDYPTGIDTTALPVFYICYVSDDTDPNSFRLQASQPFVMRNKRDSSPQSQQLRITNGSNDISTVSFNSDAELKDITIESDNIIWDSDNIPNWVDVSTLQGGFNNTLVSITTQPNTGSLRTAIMKVKKAGTLSDFEQFLTITQLASTCNDVNISSLSPTNLSNDWQGFGSLKFNKSIVNNTMSIGGQTFINGLGTHTNSIIKYNLNGNYSAFQAFIGRDDEADGCTLCGSGQSIVFKVKADNTLIYTSPNMGISTSALQINLDVSNKNELELIVEDGGDGIFGDHANWADAKLVCSSPCVNSLLLESPIDDISGSRVKRAVANIDATNKVDNNGNVEYRAGNFILLQPGFKVENVVFKAHIPSNPCFDNN